MAFTLTYNSLVEKIISYAQNNEDDFLEAIPGFVTFSQERISEETKILGGEKYVVKTFTPDLEVLDKPALWIQTITFNVGNGVNNNTRNQVKAASYEFCTAFNRDRSVTGLPQYYADYGPDRWLVSPTPDQAYPCEIAYIQTFGPLDTTNQINWLTQKAPRVLLYACMVEAMSYLKNDERTAYWEDRYGKAISALTQTDKDLPRDRYNVRDKD